MYAIYTIWGVFLQTSVLYHRSVLGAIAVIFSVTTTLCLFLILTFPTLPFHYQGQNVVHRLKFLSPSKETKWIFPR